jgi:uncharacterized protein (DUF1697 family)
MPTAIALIRGINVGGKRKLPMSTLRTLCESLGLRDVRTHIQSGNAVFQCPQRTLPRLASRLEDAIEAAVGFRPAVIVREPADLRRVLDNHPFRDQPDLDPAHLLVMFLAADPPATAAAALRAVKVQSERLALAGREAFLYFPDGIGKSKLSMAAVEKALGTPGTCRNWNTVNALIEMAAEGPERRG